VYVRDRVKVGVRIRVSGSVKVYLAVYHINQSINVLHRRRHCVPLCPYHTSITKYTFTLITAVSDSGQCSLIIIFNCLAVTMFI